MDIMQMNLEQVEARLKELESEVQTRSTEEELTALKQEIVDLNERKAALKEIEERQKTAQQIAEGNIKTTTIESHKEDKRNMDNKITTASPEYRDAFIASLFKRETEEQRAILADNTAYGDGIALPVALDTQIWDQVASNHPILADVVRLNSGIAIKVTKVTPGSITKKKDSDTTVELTQTSVEVTLVGADYNTFVKLSYAEAQMSQGAVETFLVKEISGAIGDALAADIFARIATDAGTSQKVTKGTSYFEDIQTALGKADQAQNAVVYAAPADYYAIMGETDANGQPIFRDGVVLGAQLKKDAAASATGIVVVDPAQFVLNVIQDVTIESGKDLEQSKFIISGYARAEGTLRKTNAAAYIK